MLPSFDRANFTLGTLQTKFQSVVPQIESQARIYFRAIKCAAKKADCVAEVVAISWKWFCRLVEKGKDATAFVGALARLAARAVWSGRRLDSSERANDIMSPVAQRRHGFIVTPLPPTHRSYDALNGDGHDQRLHDVMEACLTDNLMTSPADQAAFRIDFSAWLQTLSARERRIILVMALNERTKTLSTRFHVSPARISQMRREFHDDWSRFICAETSSA